LHRRAAARLFLASPLVALSSCDKPWLLTCRGLSPSHSPFRLVAAV
jgi:hypothetical protein